ncbi:MAG: M48 family metallopeptidase [Acidobacteriota bacterium]|nr:M48 family metallopeptidase [Acidobacteriota bacterium]
MLGLGELVLIGLLILIFFVRPSGIFGPSDEKALGSKAVEERLEEGTIQELDDESIRRILQTFSSCTVLKFPDHRLYLAEQETPNVSALPGGYLVITRGLYELYRKGEVGADEMAGILAHEIGHVELGHGKSAALRDFWSRGLKGGSDYLKLAPGSNVWFKLSKFLLEKQSSRREEYEADRYGLALVYKAGYQTTGLKNFLIKIKEMSGAHPKWTALVSTHPHLDDRIQELDVHIEALSETGKLAF